MSEGKVKDKDEHRTELNKYYKFVANCRLCGLEYGFDKEENGKCPVCKPNRGSRFRRSESFCGDIKGIQGLR